MSKIIVISIILGTLLRFTLLNMDSVREWLEARVEISTPLTSWQRVLEGIYLKDTIRISPYEGDLFHEIPLMLKIYTLLTKILPNDILINLFFILIDIINGLLVFKISEKMFLFLETLEMSEFKSGKYEKLFNGKDKSKTTRFLLTSFNNSYLTYMTMIVYYLNPYLIANCAAKSTGIVHNFILLLWLVLLLKNRVKTALFFLSLHASISVYSLCLFIPTLLLAHKSRQLEDPNRKECLWLMGFKMTFVFMLFIITIFGINLYLEDFNLRFIKGTVGFILYVPDLQPNLGVFWYFFTEMFDHFRLFFTYVFQLNAFLFAIPLALRLKDNPVILIFIQLGLQSIFKSYPSISDAGLYLTLLPTFYYLFKFMRNLLVQSCMLLAASVLAPIMWHIWISSGSGNANFYFAITLVYSVGQIFLVTDLLYAYLKREYIKINGQEVPVDENGNKAQFIIE